ncbi:MAG: hypothetical protein ABEJ96_09170, partial [Thiohalorhabdaceae bacterium]
VPSLLPYRGDLRTTELLKDYIRNEQQRRDVFVREREEGPDIEAAHAHLAEELRLLARRPARTIVRQLTTLGGERVAVEGPGVEALITAADRRAVTPQEVAEAEGLPVDRVRRSAMRLLATNQFFLCRAPSVDVPEEPRSVPAIHLPNTVNRYILQLSGQRLTRNQLVSPVTGGPAVPVTVLEAVLLQAAVEVGGFEGAPQRAQEMLAESRKPILTGNGNKPANALQLSDLREELQRLRGRKLLNMFRLGIAEPGS